MQKLIFSFLLIMVFLIGSISRSILLLDYELRQDYFASVLCEKKEVPNNTCKGGCHLNKELKAQDEQERKQGSDSQVKFEMNSLAPSVAVLAIVENYVDFRFLPYKSKGYLTVLFIDFRPPIV
ncbi:MAG: hypothetical protein IPO63_02620 [Bacteroidetes bacterium]|nr:hypothetical protein [Bacteroidota bacterium]